MFIFFNRNHKRNIANQTILKAKNQFVNFKDSFFTGLFTLIPIVTTIYLAWWLFILGDNFLGNFIKSFLEHYIPNKYYMPGMGLLLAFIIIVITGYLIKMKWVHHGYRKAENMLTKLPVVDKIYFSIKQIVNAFTSKSNRVFNKVVLVSYPNVGLYAIGLETGYESREINQHTGEELVSVFIATTPNPATGNVFMISRKNLIYLDMKVETAIKIIVSAGVVSHDD